jgi:hypothetical protein
MTEEQRGKRASTVLLIIAIGLYIISLFNICFCTQQNCRTSIEALLLGWLTMLADKASLAWFANPLLIISWILIDKGKKISWLFGLLAVLVSGSFLKAGVIIENEAGHVNPIIRIGAGYWLWLSSCLLTFMGSLALRITPKQNGTF